MRTTSTLFSVLAILCVLAAHPAAAKEDPLDFLHLLQKEGYADVAVDYLDQLKADPTTPKEVMELWDLEMSRSKKEKAKHAYNEAEAKLLNEQSKALLEQFIKANPGKPQAIQEAAKWSEERAMEAQYDVLKAGYATDKAERDKLLAEARKIFEEIRPRFVAAEKASAESLAALPPLRPNAGIRFVRQRDDLRFMVGDNRLTLAQVDFYLAHTLEPGPARNDALTKTVKEFDSIFQDFREFFLGTRAHFWNGRICQELGKLEEAKAIYEETLARDERNIDEVNENKTAATQKARKKTGAEDFFADVEQYYLQVLYQLSKPDYLEEVKTWRAAHKANSEGCYGYQALTFEFAKNLMAIGEQSKTATQDKGLRDAIKFLSDMAKSNHLPEEGFPKYYALRLLGEMVKIPSPYQDGAIKLRRQLNPNGTPEEGFEDALVDANTALGKRNWAEAAGFYEKALAAASPKTDKKQLTEAKETLVGCYFYIARDFYQQGKVDDSIATAKKALKPDYLQTKTAPKLAVFLLGVYNYQYQSAPEGTEAEKKAKSDLLTKVSNISKAILNFWASREEGDSARIVLMQLAQSQGNVAEADKILSEINTSSKEYPTALAAMGYSHWYKYRLAKKKNETDKDKVAQRDEDRKQAVDYIEKAVNAIDQSRPEGGAAPEALRKSQFLLADIYVEGEDYKKAASVYKPLIEAILKEPGKPIDDATLRVFSGACQAYLKLGDVENAAMVGNKLMECPDQAQINVTILTFARQLENERKKAMAESDAGDPAAQAAAATKLRSLTDLQEKVMVNLSKREKLAASAMIWIVKNSANLGTDVGKTAAAELIKKIFDRVDTDDAFEKELGNAAVPLHALGATLMADLGKYEDAKNQIDGMIAKYPKALDPQLRRAEILTKWAAHDPSKYSEAIGRWDSLRTKLERMSTMASAADKDPKKVEPKYDVIEKEARCFLEKALKNKNSPEGKEDAKKGFDLVGPYLSLDPNIHSPNDEYKEISFKFFQVGGKLAELLGQPRPTRPKAKRATSAK